MKKAISLLLAFVMVFITGCSYLPEDMADAMEDEVEQFKQDFKNEVVDEVRDEFLAEVSQNRETPTASPTPVEEEKDEGIVSAAKEKIEEEKIKKQLNEIAIYYSYMYDGENIYESFYDPVFENKNEWIEYFLDVSKNISASEEFYHPVIEYRGKKYELRETINVDELRRDFPELVEEESEYSDSPCRRFGNEASDSFMFMMRPWACFFTKIYDDLGCYLPLDKLEFSGEYLTYVYMSAEGASINGVAVGDSVEKLLEVYPITADAIAQTDHRQERTISIYFYKGKVYSMEQMATYEGVVQEIQAGFYEHDFDRTGMELAKALKRDNYWHTLFEERFNLYQVSFVITDDTIRAIRISDGYATHDSLFLFRDL